MERRLFANKKRKHLTVTGKKFMSQIIKSCCRHTNSISCIPMCFYPRSRFYPSNKTKIKNSLNTHATKNSFKYYCSFAPLWLFIYIIISIIHFNHASVRVAIDNTLSREWIWFSVHLSLCKCWLQSSRQKNKPEARWTIISSFHLFPWLITPRWVLCWIRISITHQSKWPLQTLAFNLTVHKRP